jgi:hypothetical protein
LSVSRSRHRLSDASTLCTRISEADSVQLVQNPFSRTRRSVADPSGSDQPGNTCLQRSRSSTCFVPEIESLAVSRNRLPQFPPVAVAAGAAAEHAPGTSTLTALPTASRPVRPVRRNDANRIQVVTPAVPPPGQSAQLTAPLRDVPTEGALRTPPTFLERARTVQTRAPRYGLEESARQNSLFGMPDSHLPQWQNVFDGMPMVTIL